MEFRRTRARICKNITGQDTQHGRAMGRKTDKNIQENSNGPPVRGGAVAAPEDDLRGHVVGRAHERRAVLNLIERIASHESNIKQDQAQRQPHPTCSCPVRAFVTTRSASDVERPKSAWAPVSTLTNTQFTCAFAPRRCKTRACRGDSEEEANHLAVTI